MSHCKKTFWNKNFKLRIFCQLIFSPWELRNDCQVSILVQETLSPAGRTSGLHGSVVLAVRRLWMTLTRAISEEWRGQKLVRVELKSEDRIFEMWTSIYWMSRDTMFSSVAQSCPTLRAHGLQHTRLPCPSPTLRPCSNSCPSSQWCHPTILFSVVPSSSDAEAEAPMLWLLDVKSWLIRKDPDAGKDWRQEEKMTEDEQQHIVK